jgi:predicted nucleotidyltransferase
MVTTAAELETAIRQFIQLLEKGLKVEAIVLFSSHARGTAYEDSDIDLAVISPDFEDLPMYRRQERISDLSIHRPSNLSPIGYPSSEYHDPGPHSFLREIVRTGKWSTRRSLDPVLTR